MKTRPKTSIYRGLFIVLVSTFAVLTFPDLAQARESVVVERGDSLWSVSAERLGQDATNREVVEGVHQLYAANRDIFRRDANLIYAGQKLTLPASMSRRSEGAASRESAEPKRVVVEKPARPAPAPSPAPAPPPAPEMRLPPAMPAVAAVPATGIPTVEERSIPYAVAALTDRLGEPRLAGRRALGLGVVLFTVLAAALMLWKLPMKREIERGSSLAVLSAYVRSEGYPDHAAHAAFVLPGGAARRPQARTPVRLTSQTRARRIAQATRRRRPIRYHGHAIRGERSMPGGRPPRDQRPVRRSPRALLRERRRSRPAVGFGVRVGKHARKER